jgi:hypothetical protein
MALFGRLLTGLSSLDFLNKHLIIQHQLNDDALKDLSNLRLAQITGMAVGLLVGSLHFEQKSFMIAGERFIINAQTLPGYIMSFIWCCVIVFLLVSDIQVINIGKNFSEMRTDTSLSVSDHEEDYSKVMIRHPSESTIGAEKLDDDETVTIPISVHFTNVVNLLRRSKRLVMCNIAVPITLFFYAFVCMTKEIIFTLSIIIGIRYFQWPGRYSALVLFGLALLTIPVNLAVSYINCWTGERLLVKKSLKVMLFGILCIINYQALFILFNDIQHIFSTQSTDAPLTTYYNWSFGFIDYWICATVIFLSSTALEGLSLSLMSKVSPSKLNDSPINCSVLAPAIGCIGRIVGESMIIFVGFSHRVINTDMVNSIAFVLLGLCICCLHMLKKNYFFLNGLYRLHSS